jgi:preprotein translocase subunit SecE
MGDRKYVHLLFIVGGMISAYVLIMATDWIWGFFYKPDRGIVNAVGIVLAAVGTYLIWRHRPTFQLAGECVAELRKVTWPTRKETSQATIVVIITVIVAAIFLQAFDFVWSKVTSYILS